MFRYEAMQEIFFTKNPRYIQKCLIRGGQLRVKRRYHKYTPSQLHTITSTHDQETPSVKNLHTNSSFFLMKLASKIINAIFHESVPFQSKMQNEKSVRPYS